MGQALTRRRFLALGAGAAVMGLLAACGGAAPEPTAKPAGQPAAGAQTPSSGQAPAAKPAAAKKDVSLRVITRAGVYGEHTREFAKRYGEEKGVKVELEEIEWGDLPKKIETQLVANDLADVVVISQQNWPNLAVKGTFLPIDDLVKASPPPNFEDYPDLEWQRMWTDGKLTGLPGEAGLTHSVTWYNKTVLQEVGGKIPTNDWTMDEYTQMVELVCSKKPGLLGGGCAMGANNNADAWLRNWGRWVLDPTRKRVELTHPKTLDGIKWLVDMVKRKLWVSRMDTQGTSTTALFGAGKLFSFTNQPAEFASVDTAVNGKFEVGAVIVPKGASTTENPPRRGFGPYANRHAAWAKTRFPEDAYGVLVKITGYECMKWMVMKTGKQPGILTAWRDPEILAKRPLFKDIADLMAKCTDVFPVPWNTRYQEFVDRGDNELQAIEFGEKPYSVDAIAEIERKLQEIVNLPRP